MALALAHEYEAERGERARDVTPVQQQLEAPQASAPRGWSQQFAAAGGNGHSGDQNRRQSSQRRAATCPATGTTAAATDAA